MQPLQAQCLINLGVDLTSGNANGAAPTAPAQRVQPQLRQPTTTATTAPMWQWVQPHLPSVQRTRLCCELRAMLTKPATVFRKISELSSQRLLLWYMSGKKGHNHSVDTRSFHRSSWNCSHRCLFNKHSGAGILKRNPGEPQQQKSSQVKPQLEPTSRSSGRCEFSRFLVAKHEAGTLVRTSVCETSLTWISLQKFCLHR